MAKSTKPASTEPPVRSPMRRSATSRRLALAYRRYSAQALLRFDLEGQVESLRQQRAGLSLHEAIDDERVAAHVRSIMGQERQH